MRFLKCAYKCCTFDIYKVLHFVALKKRLFVFVGALLIHQLFNAIAFKRLHYL